MSWEEQELQYIWPQGMRIATVHLILIILLHGTFNWAVFESGTRSRIVRNPNVDALNEES